MELAERERLAAANLSDEWVWRLRYHIQPIAKRSLHFLRRLKTYNWTNLSDLYAARGIAVKGFESSSTSQHHTNMSWNGPPEKCLYSSGDTFCWFLLYINIYRWKTSPDLDWYRMVQPCRISSAVSPTSRHAKSCNVMQTCNWINWMHAARRLDKSAVMEAVRSLLLRIGTWKAKCESRREVDEPPGKPPSWMLNMLNRSQQIFMFLQSSSTLYYNFTMLHATERSNTCSEFSSTNFVPRKACSPKAANRSTSKRQSILALSVLSFR